jgi:hypothetical protein
MNRSQMKKAPFHLLLIVWWFWSNLAVNDQTWNVAKEGEGPLHTSYRNVVGNDE